MEIKLELPVAPFAQARPRLSKWGGVFDPTSKKKRVLSHLIKEQWKGNLIKGPCSVLIEFGMPIPKSLSKKKRVALINQPHIKKSDIDNILKAVLDSMVGTILKDDSIVHHIEATKFYVEEPFIRIKIDY